MAPTIPISSRSTKFIGLNVWMERALERAAKIGPRSNADDIHDLRVALRRCRTMAEALSEVNPTPEWRKIKRASREVFHALGDLRDTQVEQSWVKKLGPARDRVRTHMLGLLSERERKQRKLAKAALKDFDRKNWRKWKRRLDSKARFFPLESVVFQRIGLARLNDAFTLFERARKGSSSAAWHRARIGIKRFRYVVENFLPERYKVWAKDLKRFQDLLGEVHDLDVLRASIRNHSGPLRREAVVRWLSRIEREHKVRLAEFLRKSSGPNSCWLVWREGFHRGHVLAAGSFPERRTA